MLSKGKDLLNSLKNVLANISEVPTIHYMNEIMSQRLSTLHSLILSLLLQSDLLRHLSSF